MKSGRTLSELAAEIERQAETKRDFKAPTDKVTVVPREDGVKLAMRTNGSFEEFGITKLAHEQLAQHVGIPQKYYDRMKTDAPELLAENANHWLKGNPQTRLIRTLDGKMRAFLSNRYRTIDNHEVAEAVLPVLLEHGNGLRVESCEVTETRLYLKAISPKLEAEIPASDRKVGIIVQSGIVISNSEVGLHAFRVEPLVFILACLNGAIIPAAGMRKYHVGRHTDEAAAAYEVFADDTRKADDKALALKMRDMVRASFDEVRFQHTCKMLTATVGNRITRSVDDVVTSVEEMFALPKTLHSGILNEMVKAGDLTQWGLSNAVTALANATPDYEDATTLERVGGEIITLESHQWQKLAVAA